MVNSQNPFNKDIGVKGVHSLPPLSEVRRPDNSPNFLYYVYFKNRETKICLLMFDVFLFGILLNTNVLIHLINNY